MYFVYNKVKEWIVWLQQFKSGGNSHVICIPKSLLDSLGMHENDRVELIPSAEGFTIKKIKAPQHRTLEERLVEFYGKPVENIASVCNEKEVDWGIAKRTEIW